MIRTFLISLVLASTASAAPLQHRTLRQVPPPAYCTPKTVIIVAPVYRAPRPVIHYGGGWYPPY